MKRIFGILLLASSTVSVAASRNIYDLMYLPNAGTSFGSSVFSHSSSYNTGGNNSRTSGYSASQTLGHSITDRFLLSADMNYSNFQTNPNGFKRSTTKGWSDPSLSARFRLMEENFIWDVYGSSRFKTGNQRYSERGNEYNNKAGGEVVTIGTSVGKKTEDFQWAVYSELSRYSAARYTGGRFGGYTSDPRETLTLGGSILSRISEKSFIRGNLSGTFLNRSEKYDFFTLLTQVYVIGSDYEYVLDKDFLLFAGASFSMAENFQDDFSPGFGLRLGATYQF